MGPAFVCEKGVGDQASAASAGLAAGLRTCLTALVGSSPRARALRGSFFFQPAYFCLAAHARAEFFFAAQPFHEAVNLAGGIDDALLAGEKGMAGRADIGMKLSFGGAGAPGVSAGASHLGLGVPGGMDA